MAPHTLTQRCRIGWIRSGISWSTCPAPARRARCAAICQPTEAVSLSPRKHVARALCATSGTSIVDSFQKGPCHEASGGFGGFDRWAIKDVLRESRTLAGT